MPADAPRAAADDRPDSPGPDGEPRAPGHDPAAGEPGERSGDGRPAHLAGEEIEIEPDPAGGDVGWPRPAHLAGPGGSPPAETAGAAAGGAAGEHGAEGADPTLVGEAPGGLPGDSSQTDVMSADPWAPPTGAGAPVPSGAAAGAPAPPATDPVTGEPPPAPVLSRPSLPGAIGALGNRVARRARRSGGPTSPRRGLRVRQRLWSVDPWSVFKVSALFYLCMLLVVMTAGTLLWNLGRSSGTIDDLENFVSRLAAYGECTPEDEVPDGARAESDDDCGEGEVRVGGFELHDGTIFRSVLLGGIVFAIAGSAGNVLMVVLLNLIGEVTGGLRYTIVREPDGAGSGGSGKRRAARSPAASRGR